MNGKKLLLRIRYPDNPDKDWITLEREKPRQERPQLSQEQEYWTRLVGTWARVLIVLIVAFTVVCLRGCCL